MPRLVINDAVGKAASEKRKNNEVLVPLLSFAFPLFWLDSVRTMMTMPRFARPSSVSPLGREGREREVSCSSCISHVPCYSVLAELSVRQLRMMARLVILPSVRPHRRNYIALGKAASEKE